MSINIINGTAGSVAWYRATAGDAYAWIDSDGTVFLHLPYLGDGYATLTVRGGSLPDLTIFADAIHDDITALVDGLRAAWETNRETRLRDELARLKAALGVTE